MSTRSRGVMVGAVLLAGAVIWWTWQGNGSRRPQQGLGPSRSLRAEAAAPAGAERAARMRERSGLASDLPPAATDEAAVAPEHSAEQALMPSWEAVDMEEVRRAMPDNIYWEMSAPTDDPDEIARRQAERDRWNVQYGKVLSGTGTEDDVRDYYDHRARLFGDYVEFTTHLIENYGEVLPERDLGMLMLARRLNQARLEEVPREVAEALERTRAQVAAREAWLADRQGFEGAQAIEPPAEQDVPGVVDAVR